VKTDLNLIPIEKKSGKTTILLSVDRINTLISRSRKQEEMTVLRIITNIGLKIMLE